jgi:hypothetical protein
MRGILAKPSSQQKTEPQRGFSQSKTGIQTLEPALLGSESAVNFSDHVWPGEEQAVGLLLRDNRREGQSQASCVHSRRFTQKLLGEAASDWRELLCLPQTLCLLPNPQGQTLLSKGSFGWEGKCIFE